MRALFETSSRRQISAGVVIAVFYGFGALLHHYIDDVCASPGLSFFLVASWFAFGVLSGVFTTALLGERLMGSGFVDNLLKDDMADLDERLDPSFEDVVDDEDDLAMMHSIRGGGRVGFYLLVFSALHILVANHFAGGFLQRYSHPGVAVIHMRHADPNVRRQGIDMLVERLDFTLTPAVEKVVLSALDDVDEGVMARAAFVAGMLDVGAAVKRLEEIATQHEALTFVTLIALGYIGDPKSSKESTRKAYAASRAAAKRLALTPEARAEIQALAIMLGMLRVPSIGLLRDVYASSGDAEEVRVAVVWAVGQLVDPRLLGFLGDALNDSSVAVRCAAIRGLETLTITETSPILRAAWERNTDRQLLCPERNVPVQEGGGMLPLVVHRSYHLAIIRALATTDDPALIQWLVAHQEDTDDYHTRITMKAAWERLREKEARGELNTIRRMQRQKALHEKAGRASAAPGSKVEERGSEDAHP